MKLDVAFTPHGLAATEVHGRAVFVIDTLRATSTICAALAAGARAIIPAASTEDAIRIAQNLENADVLLAGERNTVRIEGFALGNSPREMTPDIVSGKTLVMSTTNGTGALLATQGASVVLVASPLNLETAARRARELIADTRSLLILCAGRESAFALEDAYTAGRLLFEALGRRWIRRGLNDAAQVSLDLVRRYGHNWTRPLERSRAGRELMRNGLGEDLVAVAAESTLSVLPQYVERRVTLPVSPVGVAAAG